MSKEEKSETKSTGEIVLNFLKDIFTLDNIQRYILGNNKHGQPRTIYDIAKDFTPLSGNSKKDKNKKNKKKSKKYKFYFKTKNLWDK